MGRRVLSLFAAAMCVLSRAAGEDANAISLRNVYKDSIALSESSYPFNGQIALQRMPDIRSSQVSLTLSLYGGLEKRKAFVARDGSFKFENVPTGTHKLEIDAEGFDFAFYRVDVSEKLGGRIRVARTDTPMRPMASPPVFVPYQQAQQYVKRPEFSLRSLLSNPFYLMMGFMLLMVYVFPKLHESMDPEELAKLQEEMAGGASLTSMLTGTIAAGPSGMGAGKGEGKAGGSKPKAS